jgi:hypothetical protein
MPDDMFNALLRFETRHRMSGVMETTEPEVKEFLSGQGIDPDTFRPTMLTLVRQ